MSNTNAADTDFAWKTGPIRPMPRACTCGSVVCQVLHERVMADMSRRMFMGGAAAMMTPFVGLKAAEASTAQPKQADRPVLLTNLRLFDGTGKPARQGKGGAASLLPVPGNSPTGIFPDEEWSLVRAAPGSFAALPAQGRGLCHPGPKPEGSR